MATDKTKTDIFIERVEALDNGKIAMLRRGCGERDPVLGRCPWLLEIIRGAATDSAAFLVASLLAQYKTTDIRTGRHRMKGNFGVTWRKAVADSPSQSLRNRFKILLDASFDPSSGEGDLPHRLRQMVRYAASRGVAVDWPALLSDLSFWNGSDRYSQKRWAHGFYENESDDAVLTATTEEE